MQLQGFCFGFVEFEEANAVQSAIEVNMSILLIHPLPCFHAIEKSKALILASSNWQTCVVFSIIVSFLLCEFWDRISFLIWN